MSIFYAGTASSRPAKYAAAPEARYFVEAASPMIGRATALLFGGADGAIRGRRSTFAAQAISLAAGVLMPATQVS